MRPPAGFMTFAAWRIRSERGEGTEQSAFARHKKRAQTRLACALTFTCPKSSAGHFARTEAVSTHIDVLRGAVDDRLDALYVGLPGTIGAAVRVGNLNAEYNALVTKFTFSHSLEPPR